MSDPERDYVVSWEIDELATSPYEAAVAAQDTQQRPDTTAVIFDVRKTTEGTDQTVAIDLEKPPCPECEGSGYSDHVLCRKCDGVGQV